VGTARLLLPSPEVAQAGGYRLGLALEREYEIVRGPEPGVLAAEVSRLCILRRHCGTRVFLEIFSTLYAESRSWGVTHWLGATNAETDSPEDAVLSYRVARHQGAASLQWQMEPRASAAMAPPSQVRLYSTWQRWLARCGALGGLELPSTLALLVKRLRARVAGSPCYDFHFHRCSFPIVIALDDVPPATLASAERREARLSAVTGRIPCT